MSEFVLFGVACLHFEQTLTVRRWNQVRSRDQSKRLTVAQSIALMSNFINVHTYSLVSNIGVTLAIRCANTY